MEFLPIHLDGQVQCNVFEGADGEVALTAGGGLRQLPGLGDTFENVALVIIYNMDLIFVSNLVQVKWKSFAEIRI